MRLFDDLTAPARVHAAELPWVPSPMPGVERRRIARVGDEVARVTSLVRYAPGSRFSPHTHGGGEEFLVLSGVFSDDFGDHPAGTWVRNGVGSRHAPHTDPGCVIFVKLWWMHADESQSSRVDTSGWDPADGPLELHASRGTQTRLLAPGAGERLDTEGGLEIFVVQGAIQLEGEAPLPRWGWLRRPGPAPVRVASIESGTRLYVRQGHLAEPPPLPG